MRRLGIGAYLVTALIAVALVFLVTYFWGELAPSQKFLAKLGIAVLVLGPAFWLTATKFLGLDKTRQLAINLAITGFILALGLITAEAATRYIFRDVTTTAIVCGYFDDRWRESHPPRLNRWQFRERDFSARPQNGVYRIAVIGDSIAYGKGLPEDERMTNVLQRHLGEASDGYEVLNFGRSGAETVDQLGILREIVLDTRPNFILLQWYTNDVEGSDKRARPSGFNLAPSNMLHSTLLGNSAFYCLAQTAWDGILDSLGLTSSYAAYMEKRFADPDSPDSLAYTKTLTTFIELARERGVPMGIVLYPNPSFWRLMPSPYRLAFLHDRVLETCSRTGIPCLDLRTSLAAVEDSRSLELNVFDAHPSTKSNQIMADAVLAAFGNIWSAK